MTETPTVHIRIDEEALKAQVTTALGEALVAMSFRLRDAAEALDPEFGPRSDAWIEERIKAGVQARLKELGHAVD